MEPASVNTSIEENSPAEVSMAAEIRAIIADDEPLARRKLRILLSEEPGVRVVAECPDGEETIQALKKHKPDLLLLDIQMPTADGFEVLASIPNEQMPIVIFTTAYDHYAVRAFEEHAFDYLLKPFDQERLHRAIERVRSELLKSRDGRWTRQMLALLRDANRKTKTDRLVVKTGGRVVFLDFHEIEWIEAAANYVRLHVGKDSYLVRETIGHICDRLDPDQFVRIHRSFIANIREIKELQPCNGGEYIVVLKSGKELSCGRGYRGELQRLIERG